MIDCVDADAVRGHDELTHGYRNAPQAGLRLPGHSRLHDGDGFELTFLSPYLVDLGFASHQASLGTVICLTLVPTSPRSASADLDRRAKMRELARGATILAENREIALAAVVRIICNLTLYGFPVIMPLYLATD